MARDLTKYTKPQQDAIKAHRKARGKARRAKLAFEVGEAKHAKGELTAAALTKLRSEMTKAENAAVKARKAARQKTSPAAAKPEASPAAAKPEAAKTAKSAKQESETAPEVTA